MKKYRDFVNEDIYDLMPRDLEKNLKRVLHAKSYAAALKKFIDKWEDDPKGHDKRNLAAQIARQFSNVETRPLIKYIDDLAKAGKIPKKMALEEIGEKDDEEF